MPVVIPSHRTRLRKFLEQQLKLMEQGESFQGSSIKPLLRQAVVGLVALDYGESQPMFRPRGKQGHNGTKPYTLRKMKMEAIGFSDLLIANNYKGEDASIRTVAIAYGQKAEAFRAWRKSKLLGKTTDALMNSYRERIAKLKWDEAQILEMPKIAGGKYLSEKKRAHKAKA